VAVAEEDSVEAEEEDSVEEDAVVDGAEVRTGTEHIRLRGEA